MKRITAFLLALALCALVFVGCTKTPDPTPEVNYLESAREYIYTIYKNSATLTDSDYEVIGTVVASGKSFPITWTVEYLNDATAGVTIVPNENGKVTVDIDEESEEEVSYKLVATISNEAGETTSVSFEHKLPAAAAGDLTPAEIVEKAYALEDGAKLKGTQVLRGTIDKIVTAYSADYKNITVNMTVEGKTIQCYRLKGGEELKEGDVITVTGVIKNYKGTIEFDAGCTYSKTMTIEEAKQLVVAENAYALEEGATLKGTQVLRGAIDKIVTAYSADYKNITVNIKVGERIIQCYRLKGGEELKEGDVITVTGVIKNYKGTIEFDAGCTYSKTMTIEEAKQLVVAEKAYALEEGATLKGTQVLRGAIDKIVTAYSADYKNITVNIKVGERIIQCYRLKGGEELKEGDVITVTGVIKNYKGTIEFDAGCTYVK